MTRYCVDALMARDVVTIPDTVTVGDAIDTVLRRGHTHLVLVDASGKLLDIVSVHLLTTALMTRLVDRDQPLGDVLAEAVSVSPETDVADAAALMLERSVDALGVVAPSGALVGVLTWTDIGRSVAPPPADRVERRVPR